MTEDEIGWMATTDPMDMSLSKFLEIVKGREAWCAVVHGVAELDMTEQLKNNDNRGRRSSGF